MPHQCVRCGTLIPSGSKQVLEGCEKCNGKFFFFIKDGAPDEVMEKVRDNLSLKDINEMERDVRNLIDKKGKDKKNKDRPVILDIETIKMIEPGKFEIDISALMRGEPIVIRISDGKYFIDLTSAFRKS